MHSTKNMRAAQQLLARRFHSGAFPGALCVALVDVLRLSADQDPLPGLRQNPSLKCFSGRWIRRAPGKFLAYRRVYWLRHLLLGMKISVESHRQEAWLAKYRISLYADDRTGLVAEVVLSIVELIPPLRLTYCELALDFSPLSRVDRSYVLRRAVFGKSRRNLTGTNLAAHWWGARRSTKRVVSYFKDLICGHRVEFKLRSRFLRHHGVQDVLDIAKLAKVLPRRNILFARLDEGRLQRIRLHLPFPPQSTAIFHCPSGIEGPIVVPANVIAGRPSCTPRRFAFSRPMRTRSTKKLDAAEIAGIRAERKKGATMRELAAAHGTSLWSIHKLCTS